MKIEDDDDKNERESIACRLGSQVRVLCISCEAGASKPGLERKLYGQATKGGRRMPWRAEAMKDVASCDKLRGGAKRPLNRRFPNGETWGGSTAHPVLNT